jgi:cation transport regulator ChaB
VPYDSIDALPDAVKGALPAEAQRIWLAAYNSAYKTYNGDEQKSAATAWQAVKNAGWSKEGDRWVKKTAAAEPRTVTIPNVELVRAGTWQASTGTVKITREDLEAMLSAASDPEVDRAPVRIGHVDPRFDGEPALGWVGNLRIHRDMLVGDLVDVPAELADVIPKAFRRRSVEIAWAVRTPSGRRHKAALVGLALLGVSPPAVKGLADVLALYSSRLPAYGQVAGFTGVDHIDEVAVVDGTPDPVVAGILMTAQTAVAALAAGKGWDAESTQRALDALDGFSQNNPPENPPGGQNDNDGSRQGGPVPLDEARIRELLKLEESADVEAALKELGEKKPAEGTTPEGGNGGTPKTDSTPQGGGDGQKPEGAQPTPAQTQPVKEGDLVTLTASNLEILQKQAQEGEDARKILRVQEIDAEVRGALSQGRIAPPDADKWKERLQADFDGTKTLLSQLTPIFPTVELGSGDALPNMVDEKAWADFESAVFGIEPPKAEAK